MSVLAGPLTVTPAHLLAASAHDQRIFDSYYGAIDNSNIDPALLAQSSYPPPPPQFPPSHMPPAQTIDPALLQYSGPFDNAPAPNYVYQQQNQYIYQPTVSRPSSRLDWRAGGGPMNFGEDPFPHRAQQQQTPGPSNVNRSAASELRVTVGHQPYDASARPAVVRRRLQGVDATHGAVDSPVLADIPVRRSAVRRSARLMHKEPVTYSEEEAVEPAAKSTKSGARSRGSKKAESGVKSEGETKDKDPDPRQGRWHCFMAEALELKPELCFAGLRDERARDRHMDRHFDPRYLCSRKSCGFSNTRQDVGERHTRVTGHRMITIDETPYWKQFKNRHLLKLPRVDDGIWDLVEKKKDEPKVLNALLVEMPWIYSLSEVRTPPPPAPEKKQ